MPIQTGSWLDWLEVPVDEIYSGTPLDEVYPGIINSLLNNQEHLRELQIDTQFGQISITSASFVNVVTKKIWIPDWFLVPVSGALSKRNFSVYLQSNQSGATSHDVRVRVNSGAWATMTGLTDATWTSPNQYLIDEADWDPDSNAGSEIDLEIEALVTGGGSVLIRDLGGCSFIRGTTVS